MKQSQSNPRLAAKLAEIMEEVGEMSRAGSRLDFGSMRALLGKRRVLMLPSVKEHREVSAPSEQDAERVRATVVLELRLEDIDTGEQIVTNWVGRALANPEESIDLAVLAAMREFMRTMFLVVTEGPANDQVEHAAPPERSAVRRRPQGAPEGSAAASPAQAAAPAEQVAADVLDAIAPAEEPVEEAAEEPVEERAEVADEAAREQAPEIAPAPVHTPDAQLELLDALHVAAPAPPEPANADEEADRAEAAGRARDEYAYKAWKASNALWRALVSDVVSHEVMNAYEDVLEKKFGVASWRDVSPEQIREIALTLKRRARTPAGLKLMSEREEFILHQLPAIPEGSSMDRTRRELERLVLEVAPEEVFASFMRVYLERMDAAELTEVPGKSLVALMRKLRKLGANERRELVFRAVGVADHEAA
jgi:hypothetical protein